MKTHEQINKYQPDITAVISKELSHKTQVFELIKEIGKPFLEVMREAYPDRGWRLCGPASIALSRIISVRTGVPIGRDLSGEHLELVVGIFDPKDSPDRLTRMEEQTYIRYYDGHRNVTYIDPIYGLLLGNKVNLDEAIQVEEFPETQIDSELEKKHHLYPFDTRHDQLDRIRFSGGSLEEKQLIYDETVDALNDERATLSAFISKFGGVHRTEWSKTEKVIKKFAPAWETDLEAACAHLSQATERIFGSTRGANLFEPARLKLYPPREKLIDFKFDEKRTIGKI